MAKEIAQIETLDAFIDRHESAAQGSGLVVTLITYPGAASRVFPGKYAGINVIDGKPGATYSDGSKHA